MANQRRISADEAKQVGVTLGLDWKKVELEPYRRGLEVELEHGARDRETNVTNDDVAITGTIAGGHLNEFRRLRRDFTGFVLQQYPTGAAYQPWNRTCIVETTFLGNASFSEAQLAAAIVHESVHARLHVAGVTLSGPPSAKEARLCRRTELEFGRAVSGGEPVVARLRGVTWHYSFPLDRPTKAS